MRQTAVFVAFFAAVLDVSACSKEPEAPPEKPLTEQHGLSPDQASETLVKIGDHVITVGDFAERLAEKSPYLRARYSSPDRRKEFLDELVKFELLATEAERRGLMDSPAVQRTRRQVMVQQMMKAEFEDKVRLSDITEDEIAAYYDAHPEEFHKPAQVRASQIVLSSKKRAETLMKQLKAASDPRKLFRSLAREYSEDDATRARAGDLQFFSKPSERQKDEPEVADAVAEAAFAMAEIGDVTLVELPQGVAIVMLTARRKALSRSLDHARRPIQNRLWREKRDAAIDAFVADLRKKANVVEHWDRLDTIDVPGGAPQTQPARAPGPGGKKK